MTFWEFGGTGNPKHDPRDITLVVSPSILKPVSHKTPTEEA